MPLYRKPAPYRKPQTYRGGETVVPTVPPALFGGVSTPWREANDHSARTEFPWRQATPRSSPITASWQQAQELSRRLALIWRQAHTHGFDARLPWGNATPYYADNRHPWQQAKPHETQVGTPWEQFAQKLAMHVGLPWIVPHPHQLDAALPWGQLAAYSMRRSLLWRQLAKRGAHIALPWGFGHNFRSGYGTPWINPPPDPGTPLEFPDLPVYIMIPSITAVVISSGADLKPLSVTISSDVDSFDWGLDMQIPAETMPLVDPRSNSEPVAIRVTVNGYAWSFIVDGMSSNRRTNSRAYTVRGGSRSRLLAAPWAPTSTLLEASDYNASQLADHILTSTGWTSIWDSAEITDWLVPGGTWTYQDLTPIAALQQLAASIGATLETDPDALNIRTRPRYPLKPWEWDSATPYAIVPASVLDAANGDWQGGNNADGIYVYAKNAASGAFVRITGSGGVNLLPMVVDPLLVDAPSQTQRGVQAIAGAGRKHREPITIPLFPAPALPGLVPPRSLLECTDEAGHTWRAQVMGVQIMATRGDGVSVRQVLTVERQFR